MEREIVRVYRYSFENGEVKKVSFILERYENDYKLPPEHYADQDFFFEGYRKGTNMSVLPKKCIGRLFVNKANPNFVYYSLSDNTEEYLKKLQSVITERIVSLANEQQMLLSRLNIIKKMHDFSN